MQKFGLIAEHELPARVLERCRDIAASIRQLCAGHGEIGVTLLNTYSGMQTRAISCLGNLLTIVQPDGLADGFVSLYLLCVDSLSLPLHPSSELYI